MTHEHAISRCRGKRESWDLDENCHARGHKIPLFVQARTISSSLNLCVADVSPTMVRNPLPDLYGASKVPETCTYCRQSSTPGGLQPSMYASVGCDFHSTLAASRGAGSLDIFCDIGVRPLPLQVRWPPEMEFRRATVK